jgi:hypothetical protein
LLQLLGFQVVLLILCTDVQAQIYSCRAPDGTRVFSDRRCGPDAKVVAGVNSKKRLVTGKDVASRSAATPTSAAELEALLSRCDDGDTAACNAWTRNGGPNHLREKERQNQLACSAGTLAACEERYCLDGAGTQCRTAVLKTAKRAGDTWYLRDQKKATGDDATHYALRCIWRDVRETRDVDVTCLAASGLQRCSAAGGQRAFDTLESVAASVCANP